MQTLHDKLVKTGEFLVGVELVSIRGSMAERSAIKARDFASALVASPDVDWISITDNAGGNPQLAPQALGKPILYAGREVVIHVTCKDLNRNGLESEAWQLHSEGFHNVLAMTGDYPVGGNEGKAKPVFDIDSVGLISLLTKMNQGFDDRHEKTTFCIGAVTSNYKLLEGEVVPQYHKLQKKVACGAQFIINQVGFDARKARELRRFMDEHDLAKVPLIGNVHVLNLRVAQLFHDGGIPGIVVTPALLAECERHARSLDRGRAFFREFAAKQIAIFRGLGYRGVYLGGAHDLATVQHVMETARTFSPDDWRTFARDIRFSRLGEYFSYPDAEGDDASNRTRRAARSKHAALTYRLSRWIHGVMFTPNRRLSRWGAGLCARSKDPLQGPRVLRTIERFSKAVLFRCMDCGDCSLPEIAYLCPESQCAKNQRNGPCGGTRAGRCEVERFGDCIWVRAYERLRHDGREVTMLQHAPVVQDQGLRGTSSWANSWLGRDHIGRRAGSAAAPIAQRAVAPDAGGEPTDPTLDREHTMR